MIQGFLKVKHLLALGPIPLPPSRTGDREACPKGRAGGGALRQTLRKPYVCY